MRRYLNYKKIFRTFNKYGFFTAFHILIWILKKTKFRYYSNKVNSCSMVLRLNQVDEKFKELYEGDISSESSRIFLGERKILGLDFSNVIEENDIKFIWEKNRLHHIPITALDYPVKSSDLIIQALNQLTNEKFFTDTNAMEIAISAFNLIVAIQINIKSNNSDIYEEKIQVVFPRIIKYISENIEIGVKYSNNHYFFNLIGLYFLLYNLQPNKKIKSYKKFISKELNLLLKNNIKEDGFWFESSTHYHKYVNESLFIFIHLTSYENNLTVLSKKMINKMYDFTMYISRDDKIFGYGDNDSGRLLGLPRYFVYDSRDIHLIKKLSQRINFINSYNNNKLSEKRQNYSVSILDNHKWQLSIMTESYKHFKYNSIIGAHSHNDQLSINLKSNYDYIFIDTGTYLYVQRKNFRLNNMLTSVHNTLSINDLEQNRVTNDWEYSKRLNDVEILEKTESKIIAQFKYTQNKISHVRHVEINSHLKLKDVIRNGTEKKIEANLVYILNPNLKIKEIDSLTLEVIGYNSYVLKFDKPFHLDVAYISKEYGSRNETKKILVDIKIDPFSKVEIKSLVYKK